MNGNPCWCWYKDGGDGAGKRVTSWREKRLVFLRPGFAEVPPYDQHLALVLLSPAPLVSLISL